MLIDAEVRAAKLRRLREGKRPRVLELCSGCGGLSLGFSAAGFEMLAHVETDVTAAESYALNFEAPVEDFYDAWAMPRDMTATDPSRLASEIGLKGPVERCFDVLAAGLPCQAFARIGRSKLRSVTGDEDAFINDPRAKLYQRFLQYVGEVQPAAIVIENVPDILNFGGHNIPEEICGTLEKAGYLCSYTLLNAAYYGAPQMRERLFILAVDASCGAVPRFPVPTHGGDLPLGYTTARSVSLKHVPREGSHFRPIPQAGANQPPLVTAKEALEDLPRITEHFRAPAAMRRRKVSDVLPYASFTALSPYAARMRRWPGLASTQAGTDGHVVRLTPRDFETFARMRRGGDYPHALAVAEALFEERLADGPRHRRGSAAWTALRAATVPPYDPGKFPNKWWKINPASPSRTLTAHMGKDTYSHIHWDGRQKRTISVREAARLQSFPDGFRFAGAMNAGFRQIGNAVPPVLALAVARQLRRDLMRIRPQVDLPEAIGGAHGAKRAA